MPATTISLDQTLGHRYVVENTLDAFNAAHSSGETGIWFLDRSTSPWTLNYLANSGENPTPTASRSHSDHRPLPPAAALFPPRISTTYRSKASHLKWIISYHRRWDSMMTKTAKHLAGRHRLRELPECHV